MNKKRITMDFISGMPAKEIAAREGVVPSRIYQVVQQIKERFGYHEGMTKSAFGNMLAADTEARRCARDYSNTPEQFYWDLVSHPPKGE